MILVEATLGSRAYGLDHDKSDRDVWRVHVKPAGTGMIFTTWINALQAGFTPAIELLFVKEYTVCSPEWEEVRANRWRFISPAAVWREGTDYIGGKLTRMAMGSERDKGLRQLIRYVTTVQEFFRTGEYHVEFSERWPELAAEIRTKQWHFMNVEGEIRHWAEKFYSVDPSKLARLDILQTAAPWIEKYKYSPVERSFPVTGNSNAGNTTDKRTSLYVKGIDCQFNSKDRIGCGCQQVRCENKVKVAEMGKDVFERSECAKCDHYKLKEDSKAKPIPLKGRHCEVQYLVHDYAHVSGEQHAVVIGSYGIPKCVELNLLEIRKQCGPKTPIMIYDDATPCDKGGEDLGRIAYQHKCTLFRSVSNLGHTGGDTAAMAYGLTWAQKHGYETLAKLSQRLIVSRPGWLHQYSKSLLDSGCTFAAQKCQELAGLRTEAIIFDVDKSFSTGLQQSLLDGIGTQNPEELMESLLSKQADRITMHRLLIFNQSRFNKLPDVIWHNTHTTEEYRAFAKQLGIELDPWFHVDDWQNVDPKYRM